MPTLVVPLSSRRSRVKLGVALVGLVLLATACSTEDSPPAVELSGSHASYARALLELGLDRSIAGGQWLDAAVEAIRSPVEVLTPARFTLSLPEEPARAAAVRFPAIRGQRIDISIDADTEEYFAEVLGGPGAGDALPSVETEGNVHTLSFYPRDSAGHTLRIQPKLFEGGSFDVTITAHASLAWPVPGTDTEDIWSWFGDARDGGARAHHGVDIFADRGTPLVATSDSVVRRAGQRDRGGNIVTIEDERVGVFLYYAHLDEIGVRTGDRLRAGDPIGTMGNTGNAITTPPHLHLGIYDRSWRRPLDPWYFLVSPRGEAADLGELGFESAEGARVAEDAVSLAAHPPAVSGIIPSPARFDAFGNPLRPSERPLRELPLGSPVAEGIQAGEYVEILGRAAGYAHVRSASGEQGFVRPESLTSLRDPIAEMRFERGTLVSLRPGGPQIRRLREPLVAAVLATHDDWLLVRFSDGELGWVREQEGS